MQGRPGPEVSPSMHVFALWEREPTETYFTQKDPQVSEAKLLTTKPPYCQNTVDQIVDIELKWAVAGDEPSGPSAVCVQRIPKNQHIFSMNCSFQQGFSYF